MNRWFYGIHKRWEKQGIKATPFPAGLKCGTTDYKKEKARREKERANDPIEREAKKARTEANTLLIPSDYTGIRAGSVYDLLRSRGLRR
jgi:hypothetical protein